MKLDVNGTVYSLTTNGTGYVRQVLTLEAVGGQETTYLVKALFEGTAALTRNLTIKDPFGRDYAVCVTMQQNLKPSQNMATLVVEAPKTEVVVAEPAPPPNAPPDSPPENVTVTQTPETTTVTVPPPKTPEQMEQEAKNNGWLQVWGPDSWSIFPPFFKLHARVAMQSLGMVIQIWGGLFACGVDSFTGFGTLLLEALKDNQWDFKASQNNLTLTVETSNA